MASRGQKKVPKSAAYLKSIPPNEKRKKRYSSSAAVQRVPIQPPVCGVQPGRALELKTSLGILKAKELLARQQAEQQRVEEAGDDLSLLQKAYSHKGQLKHGRLQPLGVVSDSVILPTDCLGVIPVSPKASPSRKQRPRSSTAPGIHFDLPDSNSQMHSFERVSKKVNLKRRSYSAVLTRQLRTEQLLQLLSISKHTGFVPSSNGLMDNVSDTNNTAPQDRLSPRSKHSLSSPSSSTAAPAGILPPVVQHGELGMTIKVQRLKKHKVTDSETSHESVTPRQPDQSLIASTPKKSPASNSSSDSQPKLPQIQASPEEKKVKQESVEEVKSSAPSSTSPPPQTVQESPVKNSTPSTSPMKVSIVSIGETNKGVESQSKVAKYKRHTSGKQSSGRLSLGWSSPQPIEPVKGSPLNTPTKRVAVVSHTIKTETDHDDGRAWTPGLTIDVDVNEFLADLDDT